MATKKTTKPKSILTPGAAVIIRTVTLHYTGRITNVDDRWIHLDDAAWIADTGRWAEALKTGTLNEVEPYPGGCAVSVGAVVDVSPWPHPLPRTTL
jgi:hypothetical protein